MGKSYKKTPIVKDNGKSKKAWKKFTNHSLRQKCKNPDYELPSDGGFKKEFESWRIADFVCRWSQEEATAYYNARCNPDYYSHCKLSKDYCEHCAAEWLKRYPTLESFLQYWRACVLRK